MTHLDVGAIKKKSISGVIALTSRTFILQIIAFAGTFFLTIFLDPSTFGVFYLVSAIVAFLGYFADIGLAAALIQKPTKLTDEDVVTTFTIQQVLILSLVIIGLSVSSYVGRWYGLDGGGIWLLWALLGAFFLSSLKTIPSVLLERELEFGKLVLPQVLETAVFYGVAVILAWKSFGIYSFAWAVILRGIVGLIAIYIVKPWRMRLGINRVVARRLLTFGIPFQMHGFLALLKDDLLTLVLGKLLSLTEIGYIGWAKKWAEIPLRLIMDNIIRVTFPAYSRLQDKPELLRKAIERTMFGLAVFVLPISCGLLFFMVPIIEVIPKYSKWEPAIGAFLLFVVSSLVASFSTPLTNALNALGKIKTTLKLMVGWTIATWILTILLVIKFGFIGVPLSQVIVSLSVGLVVWLVRKEVYFELWSQLKTAFFAVLVQGVIYWLIIPRLQYNILSLSLSGFLGIIFYSGIIWIFEKDKIRATMAIIRD